MTLHQPDEASYFVFENFAIVNACAEFFRTNRNALPLVHEHSIKPEYLFTDELRQFQRQQQFSTELTNDFAWHNKELSRFANLPTSVALITDHEYRLIEAALGIEAEYDGSVEESQLFRSRYPKAHGTIRFSRLGLDSMNRTALLAYGFTGGVLCSSGGYIVAHQYSDEWHFENHEIWMS